MAEYADRYEVGSLESTKRRFSDVGLVRRLVSGYVLRYKGLFALEILLLFVKTLMTIAGPYIYKVTIDFFINDTPTRDGLWLAGVIRTIALTLSPNAPSRGAFFLSAALLYVAVSLVLWAVTSLQNYYIDKLGFLVISDIREEFFSHLGELSQRFFEHGNTGRLVSRVTNDAEALMKLMSTGVIGLIADSIMAVAVLATMALIDLQLTLIALLIAPVLALVSRIFQDWIKGAWRTARRNVAALTGKVQDLMYGAKVTKALTQEERSLREFDEVNEQNMQVQIRAETVSVAFSAIVTVLSSVMTAAIWFIGGQRVMFAGRTLGQLVAFSEYATTFFNPIQSLAMFYGDIQSALAGAERIFTILDFEPEVRETPEAVDLVDVKGHVAFKDVYFSYVKGQPVLHGISFEAHPEERLAIFGPTGAGKSSVINLIGRFYDPEEGVVELDGVDLRKVKFDALRRNVSIVLQEPYLFSGTIAYNLKFGHPESSDEEMIRVANLVGVHDAIMKLPEGYKTVVHERGTNLSYGERQLVCLGRALLADPRILIFDEATSSVDPYTETFIQNALKEEMVNRTVILVTHRVSTVRDADRIIILNDGRIEDIGSHEELLERNELYRKLCEMQLVTISNI